MLRGVSKTLESLQTVFTSETYLAMGQFVEDRQTRNKGNSLNLRAGTRRQIMSTEHGQNLEPKRTTDEIKKNSVALVRERTIPTERPPPVDEVSAKFCG